MARVNAARAMIHAETVWSGYRFGDDKPPKNGDGLRRLAFIVCAICLISLIAFIASLTTSMQDRLVDEATADLDILRALSRAIFRTTSGRMLFRSATASIALCRDGC